MDYYNNYVNKPDTLINTLIKIKNMNFNINIHISFSHIYTHLKFESKHQYLVQ